MTRLSLPLSCTHYRCIPLESFLRTTLHSRKLSARSLVLRSAMSDLPQSLELIYEVFVGIISVVTGCYYFVTDVSGGFKCVFMYQQLDICLDISCLLYSCYNQLFYAPGLE